MPVCLFVSDLSELTVLSSSLSQLLGHLWRAQLLSDKQLQEIKQE